MTKTISRFFQVSKLKRFNRWMEKAPLPRTIKNVGLVSLGVVAIIDGYKAVKGLVRDWKKEDSGDGDKSTATA
jgi:hypothetical protein